jgi:metal-sulfur cluster biosynthetic enzyme
MATEASPPVPLSGNPERGNEVLWVALATVTDPEYALSIVDLGLIYDVHVTDGVARITMTFTSIGCPAMDLMIEDVRKAVLEVVKVVEVVVDVVWSPPWGRDRISPAGKKVLAMYGVAA